MKAEDHTLFDLALEELDQLDHRSLWRAKIGNSNQEALPRPVPAQGPDGAGGVITPVGGPISAEQLTKTFEELLEATALPADPRDPEADDQQPSGEPEDAAPLPRSRALRVGENPLDDSTWPGLAQPRPAELRDLKHGRREVDRRLDLHGQTVRTALNLLRDELDRARRHGLHYLLVITGRGLHSAEGEKIRPAVHRYLTQEGREHVLWFDVAPPRLGGLGAFLVRVRRPGRPRDERQD